jgi:hypothetical protein
MRLFSPSNIVQFELAGTTATATEIISNWAAEGIAMARTSTYLDFIYIIFYVAAIALGCRVSAGYSRSPVLEKIGIVFSLLTLVAGACDVIENIAMLRSLDNVTPTSVSIAYYFAFTKFAILFGALLFILTAFGMGALRRVKGLRANE